MKSIFLFLFCLPLFSQTLWVDKNPYAPLQDIKIGTPVTILFTQGLKFDFTLETKKDDNYTIKANPDKIFTDNLKSYSADRTIVKNQKANVKSNLDFKGKITVLITEKNEDLNVLSLKGSIDRKINDQIQNLTVEGSVAASKIKSDLTVQSDMIANLKMAFNSQIIPQNLDKNLTLDRTTEEENQEGTENETKEVGLSEKDKQELLIQYMKRMLGESQ